MNSISTTQPRHALRWVLGAGLVFVVVVAMALQMARRRAGERWESLVAHCEGSWVGTGTHWEEDKLQILLYLHDPGFLGAPVVLQDNWPGTHGGNIFREWRQAMWVGSSVVIVLRQERNFFDSEFEARIIMGDSAELSLARDALAEFDVEFVSESSIGLGLPKE